MGTTSLSVFLFRDAETPGFQDKDEEKLQKKHVRKNGRDIFYKDFLSKFLF